MVIRYVWRKIRSFEFNDLHQTSLDEYNERLRIAKSTRALEILEREVDGSSSLEVI
jgi:hypothetical protein